MTTSSSISESFDSSSIAILSYPLRERKATYSSEEPAFPFDTGVQLREELGYPEPKENGDGKSLTELETIGERFWLFSAAKPEVSEEHWLLDDRFPKPKERVEQLLSYYAPKTDKELLNFISRHKKAVLWKKQLMNISSRVSSFLVKQKIENKIHLDLFVDPEHEDWFQPRIRIKLHQDQLSQAYEVYDMLVDAAFEGVSRKVARETLLTLDPDG